MENIMEMIMQISDDEINEILDAVIKRYSALFPDWEICVFSINKEKDHDAQIDNIIDFLTKMKKIPC